MSYLPKCVTRGVSAAAMWGMMFSCTVFGGVQWCYSVNESLQQSVFVLKWINIVARDFHNMILTADIVAVVWAHFYNQDILCYDLFYSISFWLTCE